MLTFGSIFLKQPTQKKVWSFKKKTTFVWNMKNKCTHNSLSSRLIADRFAGKFPVECDGRVVYGIEFSA